MAGPLDESALIAAAVSGDKSSAGRLLLLFSPRLLTYIRQHLPRELSRHVEPSDVLHDTHIEALRRIHAFVDPGNDGFYRWMVTIARRQMLQLLRARKSLKRGGGLTRGNSAVELMETLALHEHTPSRSATMHELAMAIETGLQRIPVDYAQAVRLRHIDKLSVLDIANRMSRSERAVHMLCNRGMKQLREQLRSMSRFQ